MATTEINSLRPVIFEGFEGLRMRQVLVHILNAFAVGEDGELFAWGECALGHGDEQEQPSPKRVEALRGVPVSSIACAFGNAFALADDGLVYAMGGNVGHRPVLGKPYGEERLPKLVEALRGVRVGSIAVQAHRCYAVGVTGELWAWGDDRGEAGGSIPLGHGNGEQVYYPVPELIESLRGVKVDAVVTGQLNAFVLADDGSVYAWGTRRNAQVGRARSGPFNKGCGRERVHAAAHPSTPVSLWAVKGLLA